MTETETSYIKNHIEMKRNILICNCNNSFSISDIENLFGQKVPKMHQINIYMYVFEFTFYDIKQIVDISIRTIFFLLTI